MNNRFVRPAPLPDGGFARVLRPEHGYAPLPPEGGWVNMNDTYWAMRERDGEIVVGEPPSQEEPAPPAPPPAGGTSRRAKR